ncbi:MAG: xanthine dehydrogenase family protein molybdopterin-binding subunit, partial [Thermomicrobiales bacterium]|nr:xanthine dehydrogenase family protein molybdopterin-binding subunit [Thermomicrobiales bacterium]
MVLSSYVGATVRRKEDPRLITGSSTYVDDLQLPGLVSVAFVRSPYAHARINGIDGSAALTIPGVHAVITAADLKKVMKTFYQEPTGGETGEDANEDAADDAGIPVPPVLPLADVKVRWVGDAVAAVVADTVQIAEDAAALVEVDWDVLEAVIDPFEALEDGAPQLYDDVKNNISVIEQTVHGDVEGALASSAIRVKARIRSPRCHPMPMEPRGIVVAP